MKLNLRKASALQMAITDQIASVYMPVSVSVGRYDNPVEVVKKAKEQFAYGLDKKSLLSGVLYAIRQKVSSAGEKAGVSDALAELAHVEKMIALLTPYASLRSFLKTDKQLDAAINDLRNEASAPVQYAHQRRESFEVDILTEEEVGGYKADIVALKRKKQGFSDSLLELNVKTEIELSERDEEILSKYGLL